MQHQATALIGRCYAGLDAAGMREEVLRGYAGYCRWTPRSSRLLTR